MIAQKFSISSTQELHNICLYLKDHHYPHIFVLQGDLGAGKTTLVKNFVALWNSDIIVSSPTFTLMNVYEPENIRIHHFDLYRLTNSYEALEWGFNEFVSDCDYAFIEWAERAKDLIPKPYTLIDMEHGKKETSRHIAISVII
ncbi:MAG: tRNA (adenosine(37)-N6)-threonylcarbamoyltransferase complex ATPase subunit type 1 TsaE [Brevinema sp.]